MQTRKDCEWGLALSQVAVWKMMRIGLEEEIKEKGRYSFEWVMLYKMGNKGWLETNIYVV